MPVNKNRFHSQNRGMRREREPRINERIRAKSLRVIFDEEGEDGQSKSQVMTRQQALQLAKSRGQDLIEIASKQEPPVCRISDYGKFRFEQKKIKKQHAKKLTALVVKEIKLRPKIANHDYEFKKRHILEFLNSGHKVKVTMRFRGREIVHLGLGEELMEKLISELKDECQVENPLRKEGRQILFIISPKGKTNTKTNSTKTAPVMELLK